MGTFQVLTRIEYGPGIRKILGREVKLLGGQKILLVGDHGVQQAGVLELVANILAAEGIKYSIFTDIEEDPTTDAVVRGVEFARSTAPDTLVICGGGSAICAGKGIALVLANGGQLTDYHVGTHKKPPLPMIVLPTTAGSGAEVAPRFLIKDSNTGIKRRFGGSDCYPRVALLDPELLVSLPPRAAISASLDAVCHAIEAYLSTEANLFTDTLALQALRLMGRYLGTAALTAELEAKEKVLVASTMANMACGNAKLGLVHGLTYGDFGQPHGMACGIMLPFVLEYLLPACEERMAHIAGALGFPVSGYPARDAVAAVEGIKELYRRLEVPKSLTAIGLTEDKLDELVDISMQQVHLETSKRPVKRSDVERIFRRAFAGWE